MGLDEDEIMSRLLSGRDGLSRANKEVILDGVLDTLSTQASERRRSMWGLLIGIGAAVAAAVLIVPQVYVSELTEGQGFSARGKTSGPVLTVLCAADRVAGSCASGSELLFEVANADEYNSVALFSFRPDGAVLWYAPAQLGDRSRAVALAGTTLLPVRAHLGAEHPAGEYEVVAVFSHEALSRAEIQAAYDSVEQRGDRGPRVVVRTVVLR